MAIFSMIVIGGRYFNAMELLSRGVKSCGENVQVHETCELVGAENITICSHVRIDPWTVISAASGTVKIGNFVHIGAHCYVSGAADVELGDFSGLSQGVKIYSMTDDYLGGGLTNPTVPPEYLNLISGKVLIGRHVIVGSGSVILPSCTLSEGCSFGALSLIRGHTEPWGVYAGSPARRIRERRRDAIERREIELFEDGRFSLS